MNARFAAPAVVWLGVLVGCGFGGTAFGQQKAASDWVGKGIPDFSLVSSQDRLVVYKDDFYGKHHLILTFFPAGFTPV